MNNVYVNNKTPQKNKNRTRNKIGCVQKFINETENILIKPTLTLTTYTSPNN